MKNLITICITLIFLFFATNSRAQIRVDNKSNVIVGAESNADASAKFEIESSTLGFLKPRLTNVEMLAISNPALGLEVFNLDEGTTYYFNGSAWVPYTANGLGIEWSDILQIPPGFADGIDNVDDNDNNPSNELQDLSVSGNQLNISNGVGVDLSFLHHQYTLQNSASGHSLELLENGVIVSSADIYWTENNGGNLYRLTKVGIGISSPSYHLDVQGRARITFGTYNTFITGGNETLTGTRNVAIGRHSLSNITTGDKNTALGELALNAVTTGNENLAIGSRALRFSQGSNNVAIGHGSIEQTQMLADSGLVKNFFNVGIGGLSLREVTGDDNVGIGFLAGEKCDSMNVAIGSWAGRKSGAYGVYLGYKAGYYESGDHKLYIESSASANPLIYGDFSTDEIKINGEFSVTDRNGTAVTAAGFDSNGRLVEYALPAITGSSNNEQSLRKLIDEKDSRIEMLEEKVMTLIKEIEMIKNMVSKKQQND